MSQSAPLTSYGDDDEASFDATTSSLPLPEGESSPITTTINNTTTLPSQSNNIHTYQQQQQQQLPLPPNTSRRQRRPVWDSRVHYPSMTNTSHHAAFRTFFTPDRPDIHRLPKNPKLRDMVIHRRDFYINSRDPHFYNPSTERGWDPRAGVVAGQKQHQLHAYHRYYDGGLQSVDAHTRGIGTVDPAWSLSLLPNINPRTGRFAYLRKHSRTPQSPLLLNIEGEAAPYDDEPRYQYSYFTALSPLQSTLAPIPQSASSSSPTNGDDMATAALTGDTSIDTSGDRRLPLPLRDAQRRVNELPTRGGIPPPPAVQSPTARTPPNAAAGSGSLSARRPHPPASSSPSSSTRGMKSPQSARGRRPQWDDRHHVGQ